MCVRERKYVWKRERERTNLGSTNYSLTQLGYLMGPSHSVYQALWDDHDNAEGWLFSCLVLTVSLAPRAVPSVYYVVLRENGGLLTNVEEVLILSFDSFWGPVHLLLEPRWVEWLNCQGFYWIVHLGRWWRYRWWSSHSCRHGSVCWCTGIQAPHQQTPGVTQLVLSGVSLPWVKNYSTCLFAILMCQKNSAVQKPRNPEELDSGLEERQY